jgi:hypothetical protein
MASAFGASPASEFNTVPQPMQYNSHQIATFGIMPQDWFNATNPSTPMIEEMASLPRLALLKVMASP